MIKEGPGFKEVRTTRHQSVSRMPVPGGWLYEVVRNKTGHIGLTYVPEAQEGQQETLKKVFYALDTWAKADMDKYNHAEDIKMRLFKQFGM